MNDFTQFLASNSKPLKQVKKDKWLNKDRFWNFVFCILSICGWQLTSFLNDKNLSFIVSWLTILGVPLLVRYFSKTTFVKDTIFLTSEGKEFDVAKNLPNKFLTIVSTFALAALTGVILDNKLVFISDAASFFIFTMIIFGIPTLFFIFKNCPISILFNCKFWKLDLGQGVCYINRSDNHFSSSSSSSNRSSSSDYFTNPSYSSSMSNIYYESHRRR